MSCTWEWVKILRYLAIIDEQQEELAVCKEQLDTCKTPSSKCNTGKKIDELSPRHARRKLAIFKNLSMQALWFGESFGLVPESLQVWKQKSGVTIVVPLCEGTTKNADTTYHRPAKYASDPVLTWSIWSRQPLLSRVSNALPILSKIAYRQRCPNPTRFQTIHLPHNCSLQWSIPIF